MAGAFSSSSIVSLIPTGPQVFINFRGKDVRKNFISFLVPALKDKNINVFIDEREERKFLIKLFDRIGESKVALVIFSEGYTESKWCLDELVQIKECMDQKKLTVIPIFYKLDPTKVKGLRGNFGDKFRDLVDRYQHEPERFKKWKEALTSVSQTFALSLSKYSDEAVEVSVLNELYWLNDMTENLQIRNQSPGPSTEFKFWVLNRPNGNVFMINARDLSIEWSENPDHWTWLPLPNQNPNESIVETAFLRKASWLDVAGKFDTRYLSPITRYEVVFVVKLDYTTVEWETPVKLKLVLPNSKEKPQERSVDMVDYMSNQWIDIMVGEFTTSRTNMGEISFALYEHGCQLWKSGLFVKGVVIRPKN